MSSHRKGNLRLFGVIVLGLLTVATYAGRRLLKPEDARADPIADASVLDSHDPTPDAEDPQRPITRVNETTDNNGKAGAGRVNSHSIPIGTPVLAMGEGAMNPTPPVKRTRPVAELRTDRLAQTTRLQPKITVPVVETASLTESVKQLVSLAEQKRRDGDLVGARDLYLRALYHGDATETDRDELRPQIAGLNDSVLFSPTFYPTEPMTRMHKIVSGDRISTLPRRQNLSVDKDLLARINRIADPNKIRLGQKIKLITGPFHAEVVKSAHRIDIYSGPRDDPTRWRYIRSFSVGLGNPEEQSATPVGEFVVSQAKVTNPSWANPNTGERFEADDPNNPIGEFWIGLKGLGNSAAHQGYGIHGTIDPDSIGNSQSMGCVRLYDADIAFVYELLVPEKSRVRILP